MSERVKCETSNIFLQFTITVSSSNLNNYFYSEHQQYLYDTIKELHGKGLGYKKISNWFNEQKIKTPRGSEFKGSYVFSILKKGKIRENRINREFDSVISDVKIYYIWVMKNLFILFFYQI